MKKIQTVYSVFINMYYREREREFSYQRFEIKFPLSQYSKLATFMTGTNHLIQNKPKFSFKVLRSQINPHRIHAAEIRLEPDKWVVAMLSSLHQ